ncbi:caspase family protein [Angustibacter luteus]|uniref:Caspase domain-containing protein n=1 Tax=Angustibacter luteus TaxID=658456 RepID=A0ABW1JEC9_9ACTN
MGFRALLIGNWKYAHPDGGMAELSGPRHDIQALRSALVHPTFGLFKTEDVVVKENLTADGLSDALALAADQSTPDDVLLIYYSGHGERLGAEQQLGLLGVDVPYERRMNRALHTRLLRDWLDGARAKSTILVLDCCYAGQYRADELVDDDLLATFGRGTVVLSSGGNQVVPDEGEADGPSAFTAALAKVLVDENLVGTNGVLTAEDVYAALDRFEPRLKPRPHRNLAAEGRIGLAMRPRPEPSASPMVLRGWPKNLRVIDVGITFAGELVVATWDRDGNGRITNDERDVTALDPTRLAAIRRLCQLADAVMRAKDYSDPPWQKRARRALETAGANLFQAALPTPIQNLLHQAEDEADVVVQLNLTFEPPWTSLAEYPWEFMHVPSDQGVDPTGLAQRKLVVTRAGRSTDRPGRDSDIADVAVVSSVVHPYTRLSSRLGAELVAMPSVRTLTTADDGRPADWADLMDAVDQKPEYLVICAPLLRSTRDGIPSAKLGFRGARETDWRTAESLADELRSAGGLSAVVVASVAAETGLDAIRAAPSAAAALNAELGVPVVFICHTPGLEGYVDDADPEEPKTFVGLLLAALTSGHDPVRSMWFARDRVLRYIPSHLQPTFGVPGVFYGAGQRRRAGGAGERQPGRLGNRSSPGKG